MHRKSDFPFEYIGGGYFRKIGVPKGKVAETLHGMQAIEYLLNKPVDVKVVNHQTYVRIDIQGGLDVPNGVTLEVYCDQTYGTTVKKSIRDGWEEISE